MTRFAIQLTRVDPERWQWMLDFALAGLAFEHAFDLLVGEEAAATLAADTPESIRWRKQLDALRHHGLGQVLTQMPGTDIPSGYRHVFRF